MERPASSATAPRAARLAARVAERYAKVPTFNEVLAAEAAKAARAAEAAAQAALEAQQAADAIRAASESEAASNATASAQAAETIFELTSPPAPEPIQYRVDPASLPAWRARQSSPNLPQLHSVEPHPHVIDPFEDALVAPAQPLPVRLLEFPRELIAARKARPRIAEGPLRESGSGQDKEQLRIFEVEPDTISHQPLPALPAADEASLPEWCSIRLDAAPRGIDGKMSSATAETSASRRSRSRDDDEPFSSRAARRSSGTHGSGSALLDGLLPVAPLFDRFIAAIVDTAIIACAFSAFLMVFLACTVNPPTGKPALVAAAAALVGFLAVYQWLFFTFAESTPGMRYAKIALCTFDDENPGRKSLQRRIGASFLAALPFGLGFLWALLDEDRLGWHDRMTQTYQRSYR